MEFGKKFLFFFMFFAVTHYSLAFEVKSTNVAGYFYPKDTAKLSSKIDDFFNQVKPEPFKGNIFSLIVPHAGYDFSGKVAANAYKLIKDKKYTTVIIIGSSHHFNFQGAALYPEGYFQTPLGYIEIDTDFINKLMLKKSDFFIETAYFNKEHSIEVQLPFLQKSLNDFRIVPIVMGDCSFQQCKNLAELISKTIGWRKDVLIVASTDMYHGYDWQESQQVDEVTNTYLRNMDEVGLYESIKNQQAQLCGGIPVVTTLIVSKKLKCSIIRLLGYTNSAFVTGNKEKGNWTVGYSAWVID